jgi:hypothetical protein
LKWAPMSPPFPTRGVNAGTAGMSIKGAHSLNSFMLSTPAAADAKGSHGGGQGRSLRTDTYHLGKISGGSGLLNPSFVEEMMGFPQGWTELEEYPPLPGKPSR